MATDEHMDSNRYPPSDHTSQFQYHTSPELLLLLGKIDGKLDAALERLSKYEISHDHLTSRVNALENSDAGDRGSRKGTLLGLSIGSGLSGAALLEVLSRFFLGTP